MSATTHIRDVLGWMFNGRRFIILTEERPGAVQGFIHLENDDLQSTLRIHCPEIVMVCRLCTIMRCILRTRTSQCVETVAIQWLGTREKDAELSNSPRCDWRTPGG